MARTHKGTNRDRSEYYGALQDLVDSLYPEEEEASPTPTPAEASPATPSAAEAFGVSERTASLLGLGALVEAAAPSKEKEEDLGPSIRRLDVVLAAEAADLPEDLVHIVKLLPPGDYTRGRLCNQLNSAIAGHAWGQVYGTVV